ncbi:MAG: Asp-tRNA(Asn)/Glu-tRNA(Gln) amidotransferase subunit GatC [Negativicutes bacterium]|jgi:aspartyl-tRNA(Asn)/glutamyl-tRNA(Gln) amidotransferase subunit C
MLSREQIEKVASLSRLQLNPQEIEKFSGQIGAIIEYMKVLNSVDTADVEPMIYAVPTHNICREDVRKPSLAHSLALQNAPQSDGNYFVAPTVVEK